MEPKPDESATEYMKRVIQVALGHLYEGGMRYDRADGLEQDTPVHIPAHDYRELKEAFCILRDAEEIVAGEEDTPDFLPASDKHAAEMMGKIMSDESVAARYENSEFLRQIDDCLDDIEEWFNKQDYENYELIDELHLLIISSWKYLSNQIAFYSDELSLDEYDVQELPDDLTEIISRYSESIAEDIDNQDESSEALSWARTYYQTHCENRLREAHEAYDELP